MFRRPTHPDRTLLDFAGALCLGLLLCAGGAVAQSQPAAAPVPSGPGSARPGWSLGLGFGGAQLDLDHTMQSRLRDLGVELGETGQGADLAVGYSFADEFALELRLSGRSLSDGTPELDAVLGQIALEMIAPLQPHARVTPYAAGSLGAAALALEGAALEDRTFVGGQLGIGGGLEVRVSAHVAFDFHYRYTVTRYDREEVQSSSGDQAVDVEGVGRSQIWGMRVLYAF